MLQEVHECMYKSGVKHSLESDRHVSLTRVGAKLCSKVESRVENPCHTLVSGTFDLATTYLYPSNHLQHASNKVNPLRLS